MDGKLGLWGYNQVSVGRTACQAHRLEYRTETWNFRMHLIKWSKKKFRNNRVELRNAKESLKRITQSNSSHATQRDEEFLRDRIKELWKREKIYWKQRSRVNWQKNGYQNSTFLHLTISARRGGNKIARLVWNQGEWITSERGIVEEVRGHFEKVFTSDQPRPK